MRLLLFLHVGRWTCRWHLTRAIQGRTRQGTVGDASTAFCTAKLVVHIRVASLFMVGILIIEFSDLVQAYKLSA